MKNSPLRGLWQVYSSWRYWIVTAAVAFIYYEVFRYLIAVSNHGLQLLSAPLYLIYALNLAAAIAITISIYSMVQSLKSRITAGASSGALSTISVLVAGITVGCACQAPILYTLLYFVGLNSIEASGIVVTMDDYSTPIMWALVLLNVALIFFSASRPRFTSLQPPKEHAP